METMVLNSIRSEIGKCINLGEKHYIIAPFGYWGKETKRILNSEYNVKEAFCVDNNNFDGENVFPMEKISEISKDFIILIATENEFFRYQLAETFCKYVEKERIKICIGYRECQRKIFNDSEKVKLDFLCVGFQKCGTTSMQAALSGHPQIYLPREKETFFIKNINEETHRKFKESYPQELSKGKLVGGIEPTYFMNAESVHNYFGTQLKILVCIANPMKALYSYFKMAMRDMGNQESEYLKRYRKVTPELFDEWLESKLDSYRYMDYIKYYMNFYDKSQIQVIVSELLYDSPMNIMDKLQTFLEIKKSDKLVYDKFPHVNKGSRVSKNYAAACINKKMWDLITETKDLDVEMQIREMRHEIFEITTEPYMQPMLEETYQRLFLYYKESIYELEEFLGMSLKGVWYE